MMKIRPLNDHVVIKRSNAEERSKGGIILPERAKEVSLMGEVLAVGPGEQRLGSVSAGSSAMTVPQRMAMDVQPGDLVLVASRYAGQEVEVDGEKLLLVRVADIAGVIERS